MRETWLHPNRRAILFGCIPPLTMAGIGLWTICDLGGTMGGFGRWLGIGLVATGTAMIGALAIQLRRPRVAFRDNHLLFFLRSGPPLAVPVGIVEAFFLGQGPAHLPAMNKQPQTVNLIARLSQRHTEWARQEVKPALGNWCDGYITIRGAWCEPLDGELIRRLNRRLKEAKDAIDHTPNA
jgi:hypothetical protein